MTISTQAGARKMLLRAPEALCSSKSHRFNIESASFFGAKLNEKHDSVPAIFGNTFYRYNAIFLLRMTLFRVIINHILMRIEM